MAIPGDPHSYQEGPTDDGNGGNTNTPCRDTGPGGCEVELEVLRDIKCVWDHRKVVNGARYNGNCPRSQEIKHINEASTPCRDRALEGDSGQQVESADIGSGQEHQSVGNGRDMDGRPGGMDNAMSSILRVLDLEWCRGNSRGENPVREKATH